MHGKRGIRELHDLLKKENAICLERASWKMENLTIGIVGGGIGKEHNSFSGEGHDSASYSSA